MPSLALSLLAYFGVMAGTFLVPVVTPTVPTLYFAKTAAPPWAIALVASAATAAAASADYYVVRRVFRIGALERARGHRLFAMFERWAKVAPFLTIVIFAAFGPFFIPRILMPLSGYSTWKYATAAALGRYAKVFVIATVGRALEIPNEVLLAMLAGGILVGGAAAIVRHRRQRRAEQAAEADPKPPADKAA
jgi:uncharacterized membrane protein YdjX (TVP38/TMEM64 family)